MSLEMAHKVILPPKKNYIPQFLKQRDINSYNSASACCMAGPSLNHISATQEGFSLPATSNEEMERGFG
jgi:hypothetical protein